MTTTSPRRDRWVSSLLAGATLLGAAGIIGLNESAAEEPTGEASSSPEPAAVAGGITDEEYHAALLLEAEQLRDYRNRLAEASARLDAEVRALARQRETGDLPAPSPAMPAEAPPPDDVPPPPVPVVRLPASNEVALPPPDGNSRTSG